MDSRSDVGYGSRFDASVTRWTDIPGWFQWRDAQEAVAAFGGDSIFVEVGCYLGRSPCSLAELVCQAGNGITLIGVDTCRGSGPEGQRDTDRAQGRSAAWRRNHGGAVASQHDCVRLHRHGALLISSSVAASALFQDDSLTMGPHRCAPRLRQCLVGHRGVGSESRQRRLAVRRRLRHPPWPGVVGAEADALPTRKPGGRLDGTASSGAACRRTKLTSISTTAQGSRRHGGTTRSGARGDV